MKLSKYKKAPIFEVNFLSTFSLGVGRIDICTKKKLDFSFTFFRLGSRKFRSLHYELRCLVHYGRLESQCIIDRTLAQ